MHEINLLDLAQGGELPEETLAIATARRAMEVCNACRYCEGFCAVFPAMELRREFTHGDLTYLANLCHSCRGCYYACQYAPAARVRDQRAAGPVPGAKPELCRARLACATGGPHSSATAW